MFFNQLGAGVIVAIAQSVIANHLYPAMLAVDPDLTIPEIVRAGATGLKALVPAADLPAILEAYAKSIDLGVYVPSAVFAVLAFLVAFGVEWKNIKAEAKRKDDLEKDKSADAEEDEVNPYGGRTSYV